MVVVASKPYKPGDLVTEVKPLVYALETPEKGKRCDSCFRRPASGATLKRCSRCLKVWYCNNDCQLSDWLLHKLECPLFAKPLIPDHFFASDERFVPFLLRLVLLNKAKPWLFTTKYWTFDDQLISYQDIINVKLPDHYMKALDFLNLPLQKENDFNTLSRFGVKLDQTDYELYAALFYNAFIHHPITEVGSIHRIFETIPILNVYSSFNINTVMASSISLLPVKHVFTHSCRPSMFEQPDGRNTRLIAAKSIEMGEELTLGHICLSQSKAKRQRQWFGLTLVQCGCDRCKAGDDLDARGVPVDFDVINRLSDQPTNMNNYQRLLTMSKGKPMAIIDQIYPNEHPEKTVLLISLVKAEFVANKKFDASLIRATIKSMQLTMPNEDVMKFDPEKDDVEKMAQYLVEFATGK